VLLISIGVSGFLLEASRIAVDFPPHEKFSVVGYPIALAMSGVGISGEAAVRWHQWWWGGHAALCVGFFALLPWGFFSHMVYGLPSVTSRTVRKFSQLPVQPLSADVGPGANAWWQFSRLDLLQSDACTTCGRCNEVCPAASAGKPLEPRNVVLALRHNQSTPAGDPSPIGVADDVLWSCTTCAACSHACPVGIDVYEKIVELRRGRVERGDAVERAVDVFESIDDRQNPYGRPASERMGWAQGLNVPVAKPGEPIEVLYWVGCSGSFSPEGSTVARAMIKILNRLNVNYRVLGTAERCTGDPARRMGEEGLFQQCAARNLHTLQAHGVQHVITHCPHCFNTLQNEYPALDDNGSAGWTVQHHTQFLAEQVAAGRLKSAAAGGESVTFHDPCYLGRGNAVVSPPRQVLSGLNLPVVEMPRHGENSFCCGAGGGSMWLDVRGRERIENQRFEEAVATGAAVVGTGCPFCKTMLEAARASTESNGASRRAPRVMDVAELVVAAEGL
jgi:Fe-S oxidoreductase